MGGLNYSRNEVLLGAANSNFTSPAYLIGDFRQASLSWQTSTGSASVLTVQLSNADGFTSAIPEAAWSTGTLLTSQGMQTIDPGVKWLRVIRDSIQVSASSNATVTLFGALA